MTLLANLTYLTGDKADGRWQMADGRNKEKGEKLNSSCLHTSAASCLLPTASCLQECSSLFIKLTNSIRCCKQFALITDRIITNIVSITSNNNPIITQAIALNTTYSDGDRTKYSKKCQHLFLLVLKYFLVCLLLFIYGEG